VIKRVVDGDARARPSRARRAGWAVRSRWRAYMAAQKYKTPHDRPPDDARPEKRTP
jgi:hypothetical protein